MSLSLFHLRINIVLVIPLFCSLPTHDHPATTTFASLRLRSFCFLFRFSPWRSRCIVHAGRSFSFHRPTPHQTSKPNEGAHSHKHTLICAGTQRQSPACPYDHRQPPHSYVWHEWRASGKKGRQSSHGPICFSWHYSLTIASNHIGGFVPATE